MEFREEKCFCRQSDASGSFAKNFPRVINYFHANNPKTQSSNSPVSSMKIESARCRRCCFILDNNLKHNNERVSNLFIQNSLQMLHNWFFHDLWRTTKFFRLLPRSIDHISLFCLAYNFIGIDAQSNNEYGGINYSSHSISNHSELLQVLERRETLKRLSNFFYLDFVLAELLLLLT